MQDARKVCSCCGGYAGRWQQWWNRDTGYGVCLSCVDWTEGRNRNKGWSEDEIKADTRDLYGVAGVNYGATKEG